MYYFVHQQVINDTYHACERDAAPRPQPIASDPLYGETEVTSDCCAHTQRVPFGLTHSHARDRLNGLCVFSIVHLTIYEQFSFDELNAVCIIASFTSIEGERERKRENRKRDR